jgi:nucleoside-diphosphate-sugar epimerase
VALAGSGFEYAPQERPISEQDPVEPFSAYGVSKAAAGLCARFYAAQMPITLLRLFSVYGTGEKEPRLVPYIISSAKKAEQVELTNCEQVRDYLYVEEAAESFWRALSQPPSGQCLRTLNVGSGSAITLRHLVNKLVDILTEKGLRPHILFGAKPYRPDEPMTYAPNIICLKRTLGWSPSKPLSEGLSKTVESMI